jgi:hypothetical protein
MEKDLLFRVLLADYLLKANFIKSFTGEYFSIAKYC